MAIKRKPHPRRIWKEFHVSDRRDFRSVESCWPNFPHAAKHKMSFESGLGIIETNLPLSECRRLFNMAGARMPDYVSDLLPSWERPEDDLSWMRAG